MAGRSWARPAAARTGLSGAGGLVFTVVLAWGSEWTQLCPSNSCVEGPAPAAQSVTVVGDQDLNVVTEAPKVTRVGPGPK